MEGARPAHDLDKLATREHQPAECWEKQKRRPRQAPLILNRKSNSANSMTRFAVIWMVTSCNSRSLCHIAARLGLSVIPIALAVIDFGRGIDPDLPGPPSRGHCRGFGWCHRGRRGSYRFGRSGRSGGRSCCGRRAVRVPRLDALVAPARALFFRA